MDLESSIKYVMEVVVINQEADREGRIKYKRLDNGKIIAPECIEFLQEPPILVAHDGKSKTKVIINIKNRYIQKEANAVVLGDKLIPQNIYAAAFCKVRL